MDHDPKAYLFDISQACNEIKEFTRRMSFEEYSGNSLVKAAVERKFSIIGEAMTRLKREHPEILFRITDYEKIIGFRNVLVHGYDLINDATVWSAIKESLPILVREVEDLLRA
ncbi:MAG: HepT-like ribonuclease domain-containing protein [Thermodesulfobacteriota bacterium]